MINQHPNLTVILTADDPNFEDPEYISQEIASHITRPIDIVSDREQAIQKAMSLCQGPEDAVIIAGKGADAYQIVKGEKAPYAGDLAVAQRYL